MVVIVWRSGSYNFIEDASKTCGLTNSTDHNIVGQDAVLCSLQDNGGTTFTHALLDGSPAIDAGDTALTTDQRGEPRSSPCTPGAVELPGP